MQTTRWNIKRISIAAVILLGIYVVFSASYNKHELEGTVHNIKPEKVWDFVADFGNMKLLNPTILTFTITADSGNFHHWKYSVAYTEKLSHWPYWINDAVAHIAVKRSTDKQSKQELFFVESEHKTCFFLGLYCLKSQGIFQFKSASVSDTNVRETIYYQCPPFMGMYCRREVEFQRNAIMANLSSQLSTRLMHKIPM